ncbi:arginine N-succinyltransferase [Kushneria phosphatilytica]|uniref:Arginine N-succinyltransferase n=1 Tax=Kushneria phosphatilytica TaxID=657387 RepID=A0A1S1NUK7_9GAMM|nr:arginine N-succinyltransferase [Kushneria phosphatilytica]OHV07116.1 arginine N-succinyltransferase [Kushneria phosphatilytica]QEL10326.1 arginine N-succinyltransferase [Kushneria phosphatilytica]
MLLVRPAGIEDLPALMRLAEASVPRLTNLPAHQERLAARLEQSTRALSAPIEAPGEECYTFVLEDRTPSTPEVVGTASLRACAGAREAYYTWRREMLIHASQQLDVRREVSILSLSHELSEASLLCAFSLDARYRGTPAERLLRRSRLLFAAQYPERFRTMMGVAMPGWLDDQLRSPFWESVGRRFFSRDFHEINELAGIHSKSFIAEVMPPFPLYEPLLSDGARSVIGSIHEAHHAAAADLRDEGFRDSRHIDLFDGGLLLEAPFDQLHCVRHGHWHPVRIDDAQSTAGQMPALVANQQAETFRCMMVPHALSATRQLLLSSAQAEQLGVEAGQAVLAVALAGDDREVPVC